MNNNDQAQYAKDVYQVPNARPEVIDTQIISDEIVEQRFDEIAREEIRRSFEHITHELALSAAGIEAPQFVEVEVTETHPDAIELLSVGNTIKNARQARHAELVEIQTKRGLGRIISPLFPVNSFDSEKSKQSKQALLHDLIDQEDKAGVTIFPTDPQVIERRFFFLPNDDHDEWFHQQTSAVRAKNFTNSYIVTQYGVQKSSTFFDEVEGRVKNVSIVPADEEVKNLKHAAIQYHGHVMKKVYAKPATPRRWFSLKDDSDLAS